MDSCSGHGNCIGPNICVCESGFKSVGCSQVSCELVSHCSGHGACSGPNVCSCHSGFKGANCSEVICDAVKNCSNHGTCAGPNLCTCERGFHGADCSEELQGEGLVGLSKGAVVGISIGSFVLGVLLCMILFYCYRKRAARRRRKSHREQCNTFPLKAFENQAYAAAPRKNDNRI